MPDDRENEADKFEPQSRDPLISAVKWLYGLGYVAVGTFGYFLYQSSRSGNPGFSLDWLMDLISATGHK